jgi:predicted PurR-regulated permease PerM
MGVTLGQSGWDGWQMAGVALTFVVVEIVENVTYPRIVGDQVKLPPVLVIFAVLLGGKLMGVLGVFIAVPAFAVARVAVRFWLHGPIAPDSDGESAALPRRQRAV